MIILYKDDEQNLAVANLTKAAYDLDEEALQISTPEEDFFLEMKKAESEVVIRKLYAEGKADLTAYPYRDMDMDDDDEDFYDDDNGLDDEEADFIDRVIELDMGIDGIRFRD